MLNFTISRLGKLMRPVPVLCVLALVLVAAPLIAKPSSLWGALAYSYQTGAYGFSYDYPTQDRAINEAVNNCHARDCRAVVWFHDGCGAFARGTGAFGWGIGDDRAEAQSKALAECRKRGGGCRIIEWACTSR